MRGRKWDGLGVDLVLYGLSAIFAGATAAWSTLPAHRAWGMVSWYGYAAATLATLLLLAFRPAALDRLRAGLGWVTFGAVTWLPLCVQAVQRAGGRTDRAQEEVLVIEGGAARLIDTGTPYLSRDAIAALPPDERLLAYMPYQPGMAVFGLPRQLAGGWLTDARVWFGLVTTVVVLAALARLRAAGVDQAGRVRALQVVTVLPIVALTLATGGDDLPVLALCLLALALAAGSPRSGPGRFGWAGLAVGAAAALKLFAWPVVMVLGIYAFSRGRGWRFAAGAIGLPLVTLLPAALVDPAAANENVLGFLGGKGLVKSTAQSPLLGHWLADAFPGGKMVALGLLVACVVGIWVWLLRRPPRTADEASLACAYALLAGILLMPSTRFGYLLYPVAFIVWAAVGYAATPTAAATSSSSAPAPATTG